MPAKSQAGLESEIRISKPETTSKHEARNNGPTDWDIRISDLFSGFEIRISDLAAPRVLVRWPSGLAWPSYNEVVTAPLT